MNHPFTAPREEDLPFLESEPGRVRARAYDVVVNGWELGSGSIRIHRADLQERVFRRLGIPEAEGKERFGFLLDALRFGAPPHGGIALGLDRICAIASGASSLREVIAFPKTTSGTCLMTRAPARVPQEQLDELGILASAGPRPAVSPGAPDSILLRAGGPPEADTQIWIAPGLLEEAGQRLFSASGRFVLVSCPPAKGPAEAVRRALDGRLLADIPLDDREEAKTLESVGGIADRALAAGLRRDDAVVAVGGGVVSDVAGFAAAVLLRGVAWNAIPTTSGAMADAAIGGKTGVDHREGKNLLGAFHPPRVVLIDPRALATLPDRDFRSGLVEAFKAAWIADANLAERAAAALPRILAREDAAASRSAGRGRAREGRDRRLRSAGGWTPAPAQLRAHAGARARGGRRLPGSRDTARRWPGESPRPWRFPGGAAGLSDRDADAMRDVLARLGPFPEPDRDPAALAPVSRARQEVHGAGHCGRSPGIAGPSPHRRGRSGVRMARRGGYNVFQVNTPRGRSRIRLFVLLSSALVVASLLPLLVSDSVLIWRNRRALETLEEKYLTRSSSALADRVSAYYGSAGAQLSSTAEEMRLAAQLTRQDPFTSPEGPLMLGAALQRQKSLVALRGVNLQGLGSFAGPEIASPRVDEEFRRGFEAARRGERYSGKPFWVPAARPGGRARGSRARHARQPPGSRRSPRVLGTRSCRSSSARRAARCAPRSSIGRA